MEPQKTLNSQGNLEKNNSAGSIKFPDFSLCYKAIVIKMHGTGTKKRHIDRSLEQNRKPRNKPLHLWSVNL